ncbi:MAG: hypothetical protein OEY50_09775 [Nitrospinota bacterium]|nr:hypothetical protein [Nitrospinota bacterium]
MTEVKKPQKVKLVEVTVVSKNHTHARQLCKPGDRIVIGEDVADALIAKGIVKDKQNTKEGK